MNPPRVKAFPEKHLPKEAPVDPIIGFFKVQLQKDSTESLGLNLMNDLLER